MRQILAVDGHVHFHPDMDLAAALDCAAKNVSVLVGQGAISCLLLAEIAQTHVFAALRDGSHPIPGWSIGPPQHPDPDQGSDRDTLIARKGDICVFVIAGRQIVTAEKIEVLAIGRDAQIPDGATLDETLAQVTASGALPVLPWGLGKWIGRRGQLVSAQITPKPVQTRAGAVCLGDNRGRPYGWPTPHAFRQALVLPGSDPLPIAGSERHIGSFGFLLEGTLDPYSPAKDLLGRLRALQHQPQTFGRRAGPLSTLRDQWALRQGKRKGAGAPGKEPQHAARQSR